MPREKRPGIKFLRVCENWLYVVEKCLEIMFYERKMLKILRVSQQISTFAMSFSFC